MKTHHWAIAVGAAALFVPAALALVVFPTPMVDTRELYAWGSHFHLTTLKHPPMAAWMSGLTELVLPANAFSAILVGQIINAVGVLYLYLTLRLVVDRDRAMFFAFLYATSLYFQLAPLSYALNSDILQVAVWLAVVYHFARAAKTDGFAHWIALGVWAAAAVLTKYSAGILFFAGAIASLVVPEYRRVWRNPRFYLSVVIGIALLLPYLLALRADASAIAYAEKFTTRPSTLSGRLNGLLLFVGGTLMFLAPGWIVIAVGFLTGNCMLAREDGDADANALKRFLIVLTLAALAVSMALALALGTVFNHRYGAPYFGLFVLAAAPFVAVNPTTWPIAWRRVILTGGLVALVVFVAASVAYGIFTSHNYMQEPTEEAAAIVRTDWDRHFSCGPGYVFGDRSTAHGMAIAGDRHPVGIPLEDLAFASWFDPALLQREGAIVAFRTPIPGHAVERALPGTVIAREAAFTLPLLRTRDGDTITYHYFFIPPQSCAIASSPG